MDTTATPNPADAAPATETQAPSSTAPVQDSQAVVQPDWDSLLQREDVPWDRLAQAEPVRREVEHRARSIREADIQARVSRERAEWERQRFMEEEQRRAEEERRRVLEMDEYELGAHTKQRLQQEELERNALERLRPQFESQLRPAIATEIGQIFYSGLMRGVEVTPEEMAKLSPSNFPDDVASQIESLRDLVAEKKARVMIAKILPAEIEAAVNERLAKERREYKGPANLGPAEATTGDREFIDQFVRGESNDFERARRLTGL